MKQLFMFFTLTVILVSCGTLNNGKLRFVKTQPQEIISLENETPSKEAVVHVKVDKHEFELQTLDNRETKDVAKPLIEEQIYPAETKNHAISIDDSLEIVRADQLEKALKTEQLAIKSTGFFIGGILTSLVPFLGLLFFLLGVSNFLMARNQRYNTLRGERYLTISKILFAINVFLVAFCLFLLIILVLAFL